MITGVLDTRLSTYVRLVIAVATLCTPMAARANPTTAVRRSIVSVTVSPEGGLIAAGSMDATTTLWDVRTGKNIYTLRGNDGGITSVAFSPDGKKMLVGSAGGAIKLYESASGKELMTFGGQGRATSVPGHSVLSLSFSPDGLRVVSGDTGYLVRIWSVETGRQVRALSGHRGPVKSVTFSADGKMVLSAGGDEKVGGSCKWWDLASGKLLGELYDSDYIKFAAFTPDGKKVLFGGGTTLKFWDVRLHRQLSTLENHGFVDCAALSHDGKVAVSAGSSGVINVWDVDSGRLIRSLEGHRNTVFSLSFAPDGRTVAAGDADGIIKLWDISTGAELRRFPPTVDNAVAASAPIL